MKTFLPLLLLALFACSPDPAAEEGGTSTRGVANGEELAALHASIVELEAREEHDAKKVKVEHILISFRGAGTSATRTKDEAEAFAAALLGRVVAGEDFTALKVEHTDDGPGGIYTMVSEGPGNRASLIFNRSGMVPAFGNTGWRLEVGQVGVAPYDPKKSQYGWHIVKRLE